jgi:signal peptidase I
MAGGIMTTGSAAEDVTPPAENGTPSEEGTPPVAKEDVPLVVDASTPAVAEDDMPVLQEGTPGAEDVTPPAAEEEGTPPVAEEEGTPPVVEDVIPRTSGRSGLNFATWARWLRTVIAYVLLLAVLVAAGICAFALVQGTWVVTPVLSGSMRPGFSVGGAVISQRVPVDSLHVRDVIIFNDPLKPSEQIVHRIVRISKNKSGQLQFNTQGDANNVRDPWTITIRGNTVYRVRWSVPLLGYVANSYQRHRGDYLLGAGIVLILIAVSTVLGTRPRRRRRHSRQASPAS